MTQGYDSHKLRELKREIQRCKRMLIKRYGVKVTRFWARPGKP